MATQPDLNSSDGWIEWAGDVMPVSGSTEVEVRYRGPAEAWKGRRIEWPVLAWVLNWSHDGEDDDIIAYRVVSQ